MNAWLPQASYPCGNFSDTSAFDIQNSIVKGSLGHAFTLRICTEDRNISEPYTLLFQHQVSVLIEDHFRAPALLYRRCAAPAKLPAKRSSLDQHNQID